MQPVTFLEALQYAHSKKIVLPDEFYSMDLKTRQMATTVSFLSSLEQIDTASDIVIQIENAKGLGIDLEKLNAGQGVLFEMGLSFEVVSIEAADGRMVYTLKALVN